MHSTTCAHTTRRCSLTNGSSQHEPLTQRKYRGRCAGSPARIAAEDADNALAFAVGQTVVNQFTGRVGTVVKVSKPGAYTRVAVKYQHSKQEYDIDFAVEANDAWTVKA